MAVKPNRKRYILFEIISDKEIGFELSKRAILDSAEKLIGSLGISKADLRLLPDFYSKNRGVISVNHDYIPKIKLAVALIQRIGSQDIIFHTKRVFGTLRKIKNMF
jgi:RNase P/RNase MRP subunit POP5